ncbi:MAG: NADH-quinone oxidoreductase subunit NuoE [Firmicutes bacterium]|nr:NADH-quinone oxidoreductase subunit NuoE [Bacillota bacterium]HPU01652.1 NADH-quinone oxidoreductase subunit NuoE [Bacillota bacterium]
MESYKDEDFAAQAKSILERYPREQRFALAMMQDFQRKYDYLSQEAIRQIAAYLQIPSGKIYSLATFYKAFSLEKKGKYIIKVCDGTACHVRSSMQILEEIEKLLGIMPGGTTADGRFSLETVKCLGTCALAPVMVINDEYYGSLTAGKVREILKKYGDGGGADEE